MTEIATARQSGWTADDSTFGARLALVRQRMGWGNVKEAAVACGVPPESWRRWERDGRSPRDVVEISRLIAERVGCDYGWLLAGRRLVAYASDRSPNQRSGAATRRLRHRTSRTSAKPRLHIRHPIGRPETGTTAPTPAGSPSQRRPGLVSHRPRD